MNYTYADFIYKKEYSCGVFVPKQSVKIGKIKIMVWDVFGNMVPLAESKQL